MRDFIAGGNGLDGAQQQPATRLDHTGVGITGMIGPSADLAFRIEIMIGIKTKTIGTTPRIRIPVPPDRPAGDDFAAHLTDHRAGSEGLQRNDTLPVAHGTHLQSIGITHARIMVIK